VTQISSSAFTASGHLCFARGPNGDLYGVNGLDRGLRWDGITANVEQLGITAPASPPTVSADTTGPGQFVSGIDVVEGGLGFTQQPTLTVANPTSGRPAQGRAVVQEGSVASVVLTEAGDTYTSPPAVTISAPTGSVAGSGAVLSPVFGEVIVRVAVTNTGTGYTSAPTVTVSGGSGTGAILEAVLRSGGRVAGVNVINPGSGYTSPTISFSGGGGSGAAATAVRVLGVESVTVTSGGSGYAGRLSVAFAGGTSRRFGGSSAVATAIANSSGAIASVEVSSPGSYSSTPTATVATPLAMLTKAAKAVAVMRYGIEGRFLCAYRYVDDTPLSRAGPIPSSLSDYATLDVNSPAANIGWSNLSAGSEARVSKIELWRTTADQALAFYRVAVLPSNATSFTDTLTDAELTAEARIRSCTAVASTDIVTCTGHGLGEGDEVVFTALTGGAGLTLNKKYYALDVTATTFKVSATPNGSAVDITTNMTAGTATCRSFAVLPLVLPNGSPNAYRFRPPPQNKSAMVIYQDRAWYGVDAPGRTYTGVSDSSAGEPNTLYFSEIDEPESVPEQNQIVIQDNVNGADQITAMMPFGGALLVFQERHCYRLAYGAEPLLDGSVSMISQRGCLHQRCWDAHDSVAYVADYSGIYAIEGDNVTPLTDDIDNLWSDQFFKWSAYKNFFMRVDPRTRVVRFFFVAAADSGSLPDRALCFHPLTKAWWQEQYAQPLTAAAACRSGGQLKLLAGASSGAILAADAGGQDIAAGGGVQSIACQFRTGNFSLNSSKDRGIRLLYKPTSASAVLALKLHYNNSQTARAPVVTADNGTGFTHAGGQSANLDLQTSRSALGSATGMALCQYAGRVDDRSAGGDRHIALDLSVTAPSSERVTLFGAGVSGAGE